MPSPFPGVNPYLEQEVIWHDFRERFLPAAATSLVSQIRPKYIVFGPGVGAVQMSSEVTSVFDLSPAEKLQLVEDLRDDLASTPEQATLRNPEMQA